MAWFGFLVFALGGVQTLLFEIPLHLGFMAFPAPPGARA